MIDYLKITKKEIDSLLISILISAFVFSTIPIVYATSQTGAATLTATVSTTFTFAVTTNAFPTMTAGGSAAFATSTLAVKTDNALGWNVTLYGDNQGISTASTTMYISPTTYETNIPDHAEWVPGSGTTSAGVNAVQISSLDNTQNVLAFRTMTASGSVSFISTNWWGTIDDYVTNAGTLWAGIASSTNQRHIGNSSVSTGGATSTNTVLYYLKLPSSQTAGDYTGGLTFTATTN